MTARWPVPAGLHMSSTRLPVESRLPSFDGATGWLNSPPLTAADLRGKLVLVNFWTYTCINWLRQLPYVRAWADRYSGHGPIVVGVHTPEFGFEHNLDNVRRAVQDMRVDYPGRDRQRLCGMERLRQPLLAGPVLRRRAGPHPAPPLRRRRIPAIGNGDPATAGRERIHRPRS
jgi:thiol-disulfide isomerase/thioredoxin